MYIVHAFEVLIHYFIVSDSQKCTSACGYKCDAYLLVLVADVYKEIDIYINHIAGIILCGGYWFTAWVSEKYSDSDSDYMGLVLD